jgi:hypothetical protein
MKYLTFMRSSEKYTETPPPPALMAAMGPFIEKSLKEGVLVSTGGLLPSKEGSIIHLRKGEIFVTDGPFTETKEVIGGYAILKGATKADVMRASLEFMELHRKHWPGFECECEVRQLFDEDAAPKHG